MNVRFPDLLVTLAISFLLLGASAEQPPPPAPLTPTVGYAEHMDLSPALRELSPAAVSSADSSPLPTDFRLSIPRPWRDTAAETLLDPALQAQHSLQAMPAPLHSFDGLSNVNGIHPPDAQGDIGYDPATGTRYYVQWVNLSFAIWDVSTTPTQIYGPVAGNTLWQGFGGVCETTNHGDPITLFDPIANRWLMTQFSVNGPYYQCIAVSQTADPTGAWHRYAFQVSASKMNDYPKFGVWPDGYYMTVNQFTNGSSWGGAGVFVFERDKMLDGDPTATFQAFDLYDVNPNFGGMLPADLDGPALPPTGAPNYFVEVDDSTWIGPSDALRIWEFHVDWDDPANTTFGVDGQPNAVLPVDDWTPIGYNIPQPGTSYRLDSIGDRLMYRLAYRNYGDHESLVVNHTVDAGGRAGVRWYEVRDPGGAPAIYQQGTYATDSDHRWMGSIGMDGAGNMALGYAVSSSSVYPSVRYTGRLADDPVGQMIQGEATLVDGSGVQQSAYSRWGDYSMMGIDPVDDCTFWYTQEYMQTTGYATWSTRIGAFRFPNCASAETGALRGVATEASSGAPIADAIVSAAPVESAGAPISTLSGPDGVYALLLNAGAYTVTARAYGYAPSHQTGVTVSAGVTTTLDITMTATPLHVVSGTVADAETGWPLYARIQTQGDPFDPPAPDDAIWSDPTSGFYSLTLASGVTYTLAVESWAAGYAPTMTVLAPLTTDAALDFPLQPDRIACNAPGYRAVRTTALDESFDSGSLGLWEIVDNAGTGALWRFDDPESRGNLTGGDGPFAIIDSDAAGVIDVDAELRSPPLDLSALTSSVLEFKYDFRYYAYGKDEVADVDVSADGGATWTNVWRRSGGSDRGPQTARVDISSLAAGEPDVRVRFRYYNANYDWWQQVDDVFVGAVDCLPSTGGLVVGDVWDANTDAPVFAQVSTISDSVTAAPLDPLTPESGAFYTVFAPSSSSPSPTSAQTISATAERYGPVAHTLTVTSGGAIRQDISLPAGILNATPAFSPVITVDADITTSYRLTLTNAGGYPLDFEIEAINGPLPSRATGPFAPSVRRVSPKHIHDRDARSVRSFQPPDGVPSWPGGAVLRTWSSDLTAPWGVVALPDGALWINDTRFGGGDDRHVQFDASGAPTGAATATFDRVGIFAADMAYDPTSHAIWQVNVGDDGGGPGCIYELDAAALTATGRAICPAFGVSERGLAYDPLNQTFFAGSWNDQAIVHFDRDGRILASWDTGLNLAGLAYHPLSGRLFALCNAASGYDVYVLDPRAALEGENAIVGGFDIAGLGEYEQAGLAFDAEGHLWTVNQATGDVFQVASGETALAWDAVPWLTASPLTGALPTASPMGASQPVTLTVDASGMDAGTYPAHLRIANDTPYGPVEVPMTLVVVYQYHVTVTPTTDARAGAPGAPVTHTLHITNTGLLTDVYTIAVEGADWATTAPTETASVSPGAVVSASLVVTVPTDALCGASDTITVSVTSQGDGRRAASAVLTTGAGPVYGVSAAATPTALFADPGDVASTTVVLTNTGNCRGAFEVSASGRWSVSVPIPVVDVGAGARASVTATVRVPAEALAGDQDVATMHVASRDAPGVIATAMVTTTANAVYGVSLSPPAAAQDGFPGDEVVYYDFSLTNLGNTAETFTLTAQGDWTAAVAPSQTMLDAGASAPLVVTVTLPASAAPGEMDRTRLLALGARAGATSSASSTLTTTAVVSYGVALRADPPLGAALPGASMTYTLWVTNTGGYSDTFDLAASGHVWTTTVAPKGAPKVGPLAAGTAGAVDVVVTVPPGAPQGFEDAATLSAASRGDPDVFAIITVTTTADCLPVSGLSFAYEPSLPVIGQVITFTGDVEAGTPPITYTWDFGAVGRVVTHTFRSTTTHQTALVPYAVVMTATNRCGVDAVQEVVTVRWRQIYLPLVMVGRRPTGQAAIGPGVSWMRRPLQMPEFPAFAAFAPRRWAWVDVPE
jgi:uncharacterized membrane protein